MELTKILNTDMPEIKNIKKEEDPYTGNVTANRIGKWSREEEEYAAMLVKYFLAGCLNIPTGIFLRSFLSTKLHCSPMRVSTKLATGTLNGAIIPKKLGQKRYFPRQLSIAKQHQFDHSILKTVEQQFLCKINCYESPSFEQNPYRTQNNLRVGSWSMQEQIYAYALIKWFRRGVLDIKQGTTLRSYLAEMLCCNRMRISKKIATGTIANYELPKRLGTSVYSPQIPLSESERLEAEEELSRLRQLCFFPFQNEQEEA